MLSVPNPAQNPTPAPSAEERPDATPVTLPAATTKVAVRPEAAAAAPSISADGLRQYRIDLAGAARHFRSYPAIARSRGWEGEVEVGITVSAAGASAISLVRSSGHAVLDERAVEMLAQAAARTPLPEDLRGREFVVRVPIRFSLEE